jgi:O-antigen/teichoic acid export membrane protein
MPSVKRGAVVNLASRIATLVAGLAITVITARLGPDKQGTFALFTSTEATLLTLFSGFGIALARRISHHQEQPAALVSATVIVCLLLGLVASAAVGLLATLGPSAYAPLWILAIAAPLLLVAPNLSGVWLGQGRMRPLALIAVAPPVVALLGIGGATMAGGAPTIESVLWSWAVAKVLIAVGVLIAARRRKWLASPDLQSLRRDMSFIAAIGLTNVVGMLNLRVDLFLVQHFLGTSATGIYSVAVLVAELLWFVSSSVSQAAYAQIGTRDAAASGSLVVRVVQWSLLALLLVSPALWFGAYLALPWLLGQAYADALPVLAILLPGVLAFGAGSTLSAYFTNHAGRPIIPAALAGLSLTVNVAISCVLIPRMGMFGGAIATSVSYLIAIIAALWIFMRLSGTSLNALLTVDWQFVRQQFRTAVDSSAPSGRAD